MIKKTSSNQSCGRGSEFKWCVSKVPQYISKRRYSCADTDAVKECSLGFHGKSHTYKAFLLMRHCIFIERRRVKIGNRYN